MSYKQFYEKLFSLDTNLVVMNKFVLLEFQSLIYSDINIIQDIINDEKIETLHPSILMSMKIMTKNLNVDKTYLNEQFNIISKNHK
jgi:hypothetical protein